MDQPKSETVFNNLIMYLFMRAWLQYSLVIINK